MRDTTRIALVSAGVPLITAPLFPSNPWIEALNIFAVGIFALAWLRIVNTTDWPQFVQDAKARIILAWLIASSHGETQK